MQAAFYVKQGPAREVLEVGAQPTPEPGPGEVRVRLRSSGVNPSDWKSRSGRTAPMSAPLIIPHSDGAGDIDRVGPGVANRIGERVWVWNGQWRRPYGTAAEYIVLPSAQAVLLPKQHRLCRRSLFRHPGTHCSSNARQVTVLSMTWVGGRPPLSARREGGQRADCGPAAAVRCRTAGRTLRPRSSMLARISSWPIPGQLTRIERWLMPQRCWATSISMTLAGAPTANRLDASARNCCSGAAFGSRVSPSKPHDT
jgi:Alcohol dehydrogenase GroES-like domain